MPVTGGPYLQAAFFCDRALREVDGVASFIRVVDRWNIFGLTPTMSAPSIIQTTLVVLLRSGMVRGSGQLTITPITPTDARMPPIIAPVLFEGDDERGIGISQPIGFPVTEPGLYWFEVSIRLPSGEAQVLTFIPMRVAYLQQAMAPMPPTPPAQGGRG